MTRPDPFGGRASRKGPDDMRALLASYVRYAALVRYQEEALDQDDLDRFEELARAREAIQEEIGDGPLSSLVEEDLDAESREYLDRILENFKDTLHLDTRLRARLQKMKKNASMNVKTVEGRGEQVKDYLAGEEGNAGEQVHRLNVRL